LLANLDILSSPSRSLSANNSFWLVIAVNSLCKMSILLYLSKLHGSGRISLLTNQYFCFKETN
jgi:hypothetical protein